MLTQGQKHHLLLVIDYDCQLLIGGWLSAEAPTSRELGLALHQAIFHPGTMHWPIHGIPETILIPEQLVQSGIKDVQRATEGMCAKIEVVPRVSLEGRTNAVALRDTLPKQAVTAIQASISEHTALPVILVQILDAMRVATFSDDHRTARVPQHIRRWNVAMAGWSTPLAGYLLPVIGETLVASDGSVVLHGQRYRSHPGALQPGQTVQLRVFPFAFPKADPNDPHPGIFADDGNTTHYLNPV